MRVIFLDNRDSFVYNLVDLTAREAAVQVFRNTTPTSTLLKALVPTEAERAAGERPLLILSPGPGHPRGTGNMMEILEVALRENIPTLGICLGFQAMVEACGGVAPTALNLPRPAFKIPPSPQSQRYPVPVMMLSTDISLLLVTILWARVAFPMLWFPWHTPVMGLSWLRVTAVRRASVCNSTQNRF